MTNEFSVTIEMTRNEIVSIDGEDFLIAIYAKINGGEDGDGEEFLLCCVAAGDDYPA